MDDQSELWIRQVPTTWDFEIVRKHFARFGHPQHDTSFLSPPSQLRSSIDRPDAFRYGTVVSIEHSAKGFKRTMPSGIEVVDLVLRYEMRSSADEALKMPKVP